MVEGDSAMTEAQGEIIIEVLNRLDGSLLVIQGLVIQLREIETMLIWGCGIMLCRIVTASWKR